MNRVDIVDNFIKSIESKTEEELISFLEFKIIDLDVSNIKTIDKMFWEKYIHIDTLYTNLLANKTGKTIEISKIKDCCIESTIKYRELMGVYKSSNAYKLKEKLKEFLDSLENYFHILSKMYNQADIYFYEINRFNLNTKELCSNDIDITKIIFKGSSDRKENSLIELNTNETALNELNYNKEEVKYIEVSKYEKKELIVFDDFENKYGNLKYLNSLAVKKKMNLLTYFMTQATLLMKK